MPVNNELFDGLSCQTCNAIEIKRSERALVSTTLTEHRQTSHTAHRITTADSFSIYTHP